MSLSKLKARVQDKGKDQSVAQKGGGYELPKEGIAQLRLVGYFEIGKRNEEYKGTPKVVDKVELVFELMGKNYPPREFDGEKIPQRITVTENLGASEKSHYFKLFTAMNEEHKVHHMALLVGEAFVGKVYHREGAGGKKYANIERGSIKKPYVQIVQDGEIVEQKLDIAQPLTECKAFVWDLADLDDWNALYIPGEYPERKDDKGNVTAPARSKNVIQEKIKEAINFQALPIYDAIMAGTTKEDKAKLDDALGGEAERPPFKTQDEADDEVPV